MRVTIGPKVGVADGTVVNVVEGLAVDEGLGVTVGVWVAGDGAVRMGVELGGSGLRWAAVGLSRAVAAGSVGLIG